MTYNMLQAERNRLREALSNLVLQIERFDEQMDWRIENALTDARAALSAASEQTQRYPEETT